MRLFASLNRGRSAGDRAYDHAMAASDDVIRYMRAASRSSDPARAVMADIWAQHHNVPFMTAVVETVEEMKAPLRQSPYDR
jgi:hypothetical protein